MEIVDTMASKPLIGTKTRRERRVYSADFKAQIIHVSHQLGDSIAAIAQDNDINTSVLQRLLREHEREGRHDAS
jgi:transposase-like protein